MEGYTQQQGDDRREPQAQHAPVNAPVMVLLSRDAILSAKDDQVELVQVAAWGGSLYVRGMTAGELDNFYKSMRRGQGNKVRVDTDLFQSRVVARCAVEGPHPGARRLFDASDVEALKNKNGAALKLVFDVAARLSGITDAEEEEVAEDFDDARSDASSTD